jgi:hypothetical protein
MKYAKILGLLAMAAAALMAFAGSALATTLTSPANTTLGVGAKIHATNVGNAVLDGPVGVTCKKSTVEGEVTGAGSASTTVKGSITTLTFEECGTATVNVINKGTLEAHTDTTTIRHTEPVETTDLGTHTVANGNGSLTSSGALVTVLTHNILGTTHCEYETNATYIGTVDGSKNTGGTATLTVSSAEIPVVETDFGCGFQPVTWTAEYTVTTPDYLDVD